MNAEVAEAAKGHPDLEIVYADAQQDNAKQVADVENFLRQKIDLLIISPNEAKPLTPVVRRAFEAKIPVIVLDREIEGDTYTTFIGADNRAIGRAAGRIRGDRCWAARATSSRSRGCRVRRRPATGATAFERRSPGIRTSTSSTTRSPTGSGKRR